MDALWRDVWTRVDALRAGDIGADPREIEFEPIEQPISVPEPVKAPEPEKVPA